MTFNPHIPHYFALIVHYGPIDVTQRTVQNLLKNASCPVTTIIIDHGSEPYPQAAGVAVIRPAHNGGYGKGINTGLEAVSKYNPSDSDIVIVMNNDVVVPGSAFSILSRLESGIVGAEGARIHPFTGRASAKERWGYPYLEGFFLAARYSTWKQLHGISEQYFLYWEDAAVSFRARKMGIPFRAIPGLGVHHTYSKQLPAGDKLFYLVRNGALFLEKELAWPLRLYWHALNRVRYVYHRYISTDPRASVIAEALRAARAGQWGQRKL